jgi:hypothetical protein
MIGKLMEIRLATFTCGCQRQVKGYMSPDERNAVTGAEDLMKRKRDNKMMESAISRSACYEENKIRDKQIDHIRNSDVSFNLLYLDCIPRYQNLRSKHRSWPASGGSVLEREKPTPPHGLWLLDARK